MSGFRGPILLILAGAAPVGCAGMCWLLGWWPDVQVVSGTFDPADPYWGALRGLVVAGSVLLAQLMGPILGGGGLLWATVEWMDGESADH